MRTILTAVTMCLAFAPNLGIGATIHEDVFSVHNSSPFHFGIDIGVTGSYVSLSVGENLRFPSHYDIRVTSHTADAPKYWNIVQAGDVFSKGAIHSGKLPALLTPFMGSNFPTLTVGEEFHIATGYGDYNSMNYDVIPIFGWAHFRITNGVLTVVDSVLTLDSPGVIVGTTTLAPEPSSLTMIVMPMLVLAALRPR